jgi:hypothetical protein
MDTAHTEGVALIILTVVFLAMGVLAWRVQARTGVPNQWRYVAPVVAVLAFLLALSALAGNVLEGR